MQDEFSTMKDSLLKPPSYISSLISLNWADLRLYRLKNPVCECSPKVCFFIMWRIFARYPMANSSANSPPCCQTMYVVVFEQLLGWKMFAEVWSYSCWNAWYAANSDRGIDATQGPSYWQRSRYCSVVRTVSLIPISILLWGVNLRYQRRRICWPFNFVRRRGIGCSRQRCRWQPNYLWRRRDTKEKTISGWVRQLK